ncbi:HD domain protein [Desulfosarcina cetonica]|nr:HD domain protein [Desulfosarcina cetonica]
MMQEIFDVIFDLAMPFLDTRENKTHTRISCRFAERLLKKEGGDPHVVYPALILHDVGWKCIPEDLQLSAFGPGDKDMKLNRIHEIEGARIARDILEQVRYPQHLIKEITDIIIGHDSRKIAISINDAVVKDADKLWRYSEDGARINALRFALSFSQNLDRLRKKLDEWFITRTGLTIAKEELRLRESSLDRLSAPSHSL